MTTTLTPSSQTRPPDPRAPVGRPIRRFAGLDGLRALAVCAVIVYHVFPGVLPGGFIGVDVFFVISGFLITSLLVSERASTGRIRLKQFWSRRARRLVPALAALLLVICTAAWAVGGDLLVGIGRQVAAALTFSSNWADIAAHSSYFNQDEPTLFRNLWSLAVEEQFYLVWPLLILAIMLIKHKGARLAIVYLIAVASAVLMAVLYDPHGDATRVYFGSDTHSFGLALGAALALFVDRLKPLDLDMGETAMQLFVRRWLPKLGVLSLVGLGCAAWWLHDDWAITYQWGLFAVSILAAGAIWAAVTGRSRLGRALDAAPLRYVGARSYGLYLWHWPVFVLVVAVLPPARTNGTPSMPGAIALGVTVVAAGLSYRFVEQPIRVHGFRGSIRLALQRVRGSRRRSLAGLAIVTVAALCLMGTVGAIVFAPSETRAQAFVEQGKAAVAAAQAAQKAAAREGRAPSSGATPSTGGPGSGSPAPAAPLTPGDQLPTGDQIDAIGDSVMLASAPALQQAFPGIAIDAVVSRQMYTAPGILQALSSAGHLRRVVLIGLGTNGSISLADLTQIQQIAGPDRELIFVTVQAPRGWTDGVNQMLTAFAAANPRSVGLADWRSAIAAHLDLLAPDQIHPGMTGGRIYATAVTQALEGLIQRTKFRPRQVTWH